MIRTTLAACALLLAGACANMQHAMVAPVTLVSASGQGASAGEIWISTTSGGVALRVNLHGLPPGDHGMHLHANASCAPAANASGEMTPAGGAGSHFDPSATGHHEGPNGHGHLGDLPLLHVSADGTAKATLLAPRFHNAEELRGHAIVIHAGGDNYSDMPAPLGGGGARIACGVVQ